MESLARLIGWKLSLHGVPVQGQVTLDLRRRREQPLPERHAGRLRARQRPPRRLTRPPARASALYAQLPGPARPRRRATPPGLGDHGQGRRARRAPSRPTSPASCASPTAPRPPARRSASSTWRPARPGRRSRRPACGPDGSWATSVAAARQRPGPRGVRRRRARARGWSPRRSRSRSSRACRSRATSGARKAGTAFAVSGRSRPSPAARAVPARAPGRLALGDGPAQAHQRARRALRDQGAAEEARALPRLDHRRRRHPPPHPARARTEVLPSASEHQGE